MNETLFVAHELKSGLVVALEAKSQLFKISTILMNNIFWKIESLVSSDENFRRIQHRVTFVDGRRIISGHSSDIRSTDGWESGILAARRGHAAVGPVRRIFQFDFRWVSDGENGCCVGASKLKGFVDPSDTGSVDGLLRCRRRSGDPRLGRRRRRRRWSVNDGVVAAFFGISSDL